MALKTRLTQLFGLEHPIVLGPMTPAGGAELSSAVAEAGGLGLLGAGYGDRTWFDAEASKVERSDIGCGFITWSIAHDLELLDAAIARFPKAIMLSFGDPTFLARRIKDAGVRLICQVQTLEQALHAVDCGADVVVAQGSEAGGHGMAACSSMSFIPTVVDKLAARSPNVAVLGAGGIADGRGLAACMMLGADGALMGTRFLATQEAMIHVAVKRKLVETSGDATIRTSVYDIVREKAWPPGYTLRAIRNDFIEKWHGREDELRTRQAPELSRLQAAWAAGDCDTINVVAGEAVGLISDLPRAGDLVRRIAHDAQECLARFASSGTSIAA